MFVEKYGFKVISQSEAVAPIFLNIGDNLIKYREKYPELLSEENIERAAKRFGSKKENLVLIEALVNIRFKFDKKIYEIDQFEPILVDGASTPVTIGDIRPFGPNVNRAYFVHDILCALFHNVPRKTADRIFTCFCEIDGTNRTARAIMYTCLRMFGGIPWRQIDPKDHWNYNRVALDIWS